MATADKGKLVTFDEFCRIVGDDQKADLIDGVIYLASPDNTDANELSGWLSWLLRGYVTKKDLGKVYINRVAFRLNDLNAPEPDIGFIRNGRLAAVKRGFVQGPPDLAVEVVSPDSVERDYEKKWKQYQQAGVREYWIVDELEKKVILLRLQRGEFRQARVRQGVLASKVLTGFWLRPEWLWQVPLPDEMRTLRQILKGPARSA
jgi:Uma2 family endonuclease